ncbi:PKD domain-containing protein, partial [Niastella populi]|uniref:PKD domain-containing protein n=1 Tax=Niastella populi TaxID=550983 RepID=UPI0010562709
MKKLLSSLFVYFQFIFIIILSVPYTGSAQTATASAGTQTGEHSKPRSGMVAGKFNYTSFREKVKSNDDAWLKYNEPGYYNHPELGILPEGAPENCVEILSKRKVDERFFRSLTDTNRIYQQKALGDLNMLKNGHWTTIDHKLQPVENGKYTSVNTQEPVSFDIPNRNISIHTVYGKISFNNWKLLANKKGQEIALATPDWTNYTIGEDGMYVTNIFSGIDAELRVFRGVIKTNFIIKTNEFGEYDELIFRDEFNEGKNTSIRFTDNAKSKKGVGQLTVFNNGKDALKVDAGVAYARFTKERSIGLAYAIGDKWMDVVVPAKWISENIGKYELVVDPIVTASNTLAQASITGSRYNASCNFANSCDYNLNVAQPANTTITNISFNFSYVANGSTCWLQDGAVKIGSGACSSPSAGGLVWFCNGIGGGTCNASNFSILGDVQSCMPVPSCAVQNIPFILKFYRSCWGASGCSNSCIGAAGPWTMTLECQDISLNNPSNPINTPALMVCQGLTHNLSASAKNGVPPYAYSWSFDPSGTPVAATGGSANVTFPGNGMHTLYVSATDACNNTVAGSQIIGVSAPVTTTENVTICASA